MTTAGTAAPPAGVARQQEIAGTEILVRALCVCGLAAEARVARAAGFQAVVGGGDASRTAALLAATAPRAKCLVSFGVAGGLMPQLRSGDLILSTEIIAERQRWRADNRFAAAMAELAARIGAVSGPVFGASEMLATAKQKRQAWRATGALAGDLESAAVAQTAAAIGIPFLVLRAIADPANRSLPPAALIPLAENGSPAFGRVAAAVLRRPWQIVELFGLARETRRALDALAGPACALRLALGGTA
jgi:adenosylhomocysteine nucleosidase